MTTRRRLLWALCVPLLWVAFATVSAPVLAADAPDGWRLLRSGGYVVLIRHAKTVPGTGDPPGFRLTDCSTQRLLSDEGRAQAKRLGEAFAAKKIPLAGVYSSEWCRCVDTARIAFAPTTRVDTWPALNSHFDNPQTGPIQAQQVLGGIGVRMRAGQNIVLVTHQVNISQLVGENVSMGEAVVARLERDRLRAVARIPYD